MNTPQPDSEHAKAFSEDNFWSKLRAAKNFLGEETLKLSLKGYLVMMDKDTPIAAKGLILAALGYLISPIDLIPDVMLPVGYSDDMAVLVATLTSVAAHTKDEHSELAAQKAKAFFS